MNINYDYSNSKTIPKVIASHRLYWQSLQCIKRIDVVYIASTELRMTAVHKLCCQWQHHINSTHINITHRNPASARNSQALLIVTATHKRYKQRSQHIMSTVTHCNAQTLLTMTTAHTQCWQCMQHINSTNSDRSASTMLWNRLHRNNGVNSSKQIHYV